MTFIETLDGETEDDWRVSVERVLASLVDKPNWWHPFTVGPIIEFEGRNFRSFRCAAGSVTAWLMIAPKKKQLPRMLLVTGVRVSDNQPVVGVWCDGEEREVGSQPILSQLADLSPQTGLSKLDQIRRRIREIMSRGIRGGT